MKDNKTVYASPEMEVILFEEKDILLLSGEAGNTDEDIDWIGNLNL